MHYQDDMTGFLSELKGGAAPTVTAAPPPPSGPLVSPTAAAAPGAPNPSTALRNPRNALNGFTPPAFPAFSGALSSSAGGGGGPVSRTFSELRSATGEASLGSFNNGVAALNPLPPSLSADPPLAAQPVPQASPPSPIPHLNHSAFATNSSYHPLGALNHLNQSPSSVARQTLNYSPQPPHTAPVSAPGITSSAPQQAQQVAQSAPISSVPPSSSALHRLASAQQTQQHPSQHQQQSQQAQHQQLHPAPHQQGHQVQQPASQARSQVPDQRQLASQPQLSAAHHHPMHRPADLQHYAAYAAPQPQVIYRGHPAEASAMLQPVAPHAEAPSVSQPVAVNRRASSAQEQNRGSSGTPAKRARSNADRPSQLSPTTPKSAAAAGSSPGAAAYWGAQTGSSNKSRSGNTAPTNVDTGANGHATSVPTEEQSRPERKREREKRRRETMNTRFNELAACLVISAGGKSDKESILAEAVEHVKKQAAMIKELEKQNRELMSEASDLRAEKTELRHDKNYIREERDRLKEEVESLKAELRRRKKHKTENGYVKDEGGISGSAKLKDGENHGMKTEVQV